MSYWLFSMENFPDTRWKRESAEIIMYDGIIPFGAVEAGKWIPLQRIYKRIFATDDQDILNYKPKSERLILDTDLANFINGVYGHRGVLCVPEEMYQTQREQVEEFARATHIKYLNDMMEEFETQRDARIASGTGRMLPTLREQAAYESTGRPRPYSAQAVEAQRDPGANVAKKITEALEKFIASRENPQDKERPVEVLTTVPEEPNVEHTGSPHSGNKKR